MSRFRVLACAVLITGMTASAAAAQQPENDRTELRVAPGVFRQGGIFGDDSPRRADGTFGATVGLQVRRHPARRSGFSFEATLQPMGVRNPHFDETLRSVYVQAGLEIGRRFYVRPSGGVAVRFWSGAFAADPSIGLALGLAIGYRRPPTERVSVWPELVLRSSAEPGAGHWMIGVQVPVAWSRR